MEHAGMEHQHEIDPFVVMMWGKMDDENENKKKIMERMLDEKIMVMKNMITLLEYKTETMEMIKPMIEEM